MVGVLLLGREVISAECLLVAAFINTSMDGDDSCGLLYAWDVSYMGLTHQDQVMNRSSSGKFRGI